MRLNPRTTNAEYRECTTCDKREQCGKSIVREDEEQNNRHRHFKS